jgi:hypothetical protein
MHAVPVTGLAISTATLLAEHSIFTHGPPYQLVGAFIFAGFLGALLAAYPLTELAARRHEQHLALRRVPARHGGTQRRGRF